VSLLFGRGTAESRSIGPWDVPWHGSSRSLGGGMKSALSLIPVYAATALIADSIATLPLHAYRDVGELRQRVKEQPRLVTAPQLHGTRVDWLHQALASLLLRGNAYGVIVQTSRTGWPERVSWVHPDHMNVDESGSSPRYIYSGKEIDPLSLIHVAGYTVPGSVVGLSPITLFRLQLTNALSAQEFEASFFERGVAPSGVLKNTAQVMKPEDTEIAKARFKAAVANRDIFVTGKDWEWSALQVSTQDALFLQAIEASATEVAAIYRVSPEDIGGKTGHSRTYQTLVMEMQKYAQRTLLPWTARLEAALDPHLPADQYVRFNLDAVARADLKTRMETHRIALETGVETLDEARALEERPPLTDEQIKQWQDRHGRVGRYRRPPGDDLDGGTEA